MPAVLSQRPELMFLSNLQTGEDLIMQFNPTEFQRKIRSLWSRKNVLGESIRPLDYLGTANQTLQMQLYYRAEDAQQYAEGEDAMRYLESLLYPPAEADSIGGARPPRVLFVWPNSVSLTVVIEEIAFTHQMFDLQGRTIQFTANLKMEVASLRRITQEEIRERGARREPQQTGGGS
jgi:hypothetical protein